MRGRAACSGNGGRVLGGGDAGGTTPSRADEGGCVKLGGNTAGQQQVPRCGCLLKAMEARSQ